jgi:hypothetical protein
MKKSTIGAAVLGVLSALTVGATGPGGGSADGGRLGIRDENTDAAGNQIVPNQFNTAYVDVTCPDD